MINSFTNRYFFLSNFSPSIICDLTFGGLVYPTVEHAYQAAKSLDYNVRRVFTKIDSPSTAKRRGSKIQLRADWESVKYNIMLSYVLQKFRDAKLKKMLLDTGDQELIEGNTWNDTYWGVCNGVGKNNLGKILMDVRERSKCQEL